MRKTVHPAADLACEFCPETADPEGARDWVFVSASRSHGAFGSGRLACGRCILEHPDIAGWPGYLVDPASP